MKVVVINLRGATVAELGSVVTSTTVNELKQQIYNETKFYPERQRLTFKTTNDKSGEVKQVALIDESATLSFYGMGANGESTSVVVFKDLGIQISWRLVYVIEYAGPLLILPLMYMYRSWTSAEQYKLSLTQTVAFRLAMLHFFKREIESLFVHRFSHATMPLLRLPINCLHYWILCGLAIGYYLFHPKYQAPFGDNIAWIAVFSSAFLIFEALNCKCHLILRNLRPRGTNARGIPRGYGFDTVSCANYMWESLAWIAFSLLTSLFTSYIFTIVATGQMLEWALKRHAAYKKQDANYPKSIKAMIPGII